MFQRAGGSRRRPRAFQCEALEDRNLLSTVTAEVQNTAHAVLKGTIEGTASFVNEPTVVGYDPETNSLIFDVTIRSEGSGHLTVVGTVEEGAFITTQRSLITFDLDTNAATSSVIVDGTGTITARNGDQLSFTYSGASTSTSDGTGVFNGEIAIIIVGGTGRFEDATGSGTAQTSHPTPLAGEFAFQAIFDVHISP